MTKYPPRKLLAATLGLATLSLGGCISCGNLVVPQDAATDVPAREDAGPEDVGAADEDTGGTKE